MEFFSFTSIAMRLGAVFDMLGNYDETPVPTYLDYLWVYLLVGGVCFAVVYVFEAIALYTIGKRQGFKNTWMAFVPFLNTYYIGVLSEKNKTFGMKSKYVSMGAAIAEAAHFALYVLFYVALFALMNGGYIRPQLKTEIYAGQEIFSYEYVVYGLPSSLAWMGWVFNHLETLVITWIEIVYLICNVFLLISFFRTYATSNSIVYAILSIIFPVKGIIMFAVRKHNGVNYADYLRQQRQKQYAAYQEYMRTNGQPDYYGNNRQQGGNPYEQQNSAPPEDPFGGFGADSFGGNAEGKSAPPEDPFGDFSFGSGSSDGGAEGSSSQTGSQDVRTEDDGADKNV